jgi:hypothetical protein
LKEPAVIEHTTTDEKHEPAADTYEGKFVSISGNKLVTKCEGIEQTHTLTADAKVIRNGEAYKAEDLKRGNHLRITTRQGEKNLAIGIECIQRGETRSTASAD